MKNTAAIILAAGKGTRINARRKNKVSYKLSGKPMICYPVEALQLAGIETIVVVVKFAEESVREALRGKKLVFARQGKKKGTAAALEAGIRQLPDSVERVIVMHGDDAAFYSADLFRFLLAQNRLSGAEVTLLSIEVDKPTVGRILRDKKGRVKGIVEQKNATEEEKKIREINIGLYCFDREFLKRRLREIEMNPVSREYYLTDIVAVALKNKEKVQVCLYPKSTIWYGVNTRSQWLRARALMQR